LTTRKASYEPTTYKHTNCGNRAMARSLKRWNWEAGVDRNIAFRARFFIEGLGSRYVLPMLFPQRPSIKNWAIFLIWEKGYGY